MILKSKIIPVIGKYLFDRELCFHKDILNDKVAKEKKKQIKKNFDLHKRGVAAFFICILIYWKYVKIYENRTATAQGGT